MRILHVVLTPRHSGAEMLVRDLSVLHSEAGHDVGVCALNPSAPEFLREIEATRAAGVRWALPDRPLGRFARFAFLRSLIRASRSEVVVAHSVIPSAYARICAPRSVPVVSVLHDGSENDYPSGRIRQLERLISSRASALVAISPRALSNYAANVRPHPRAALIPNGIHPGPFTAAASEREAIRRRMGLARDARLVLQVGRLSPTKRQHLSLDSIVPLFSELPSLQVWFAGIEEDVGYCAQLRDRCADGERAQRIRFLGPRSDVAPLLAAADLYVMPSVYESQGIALLEALASGVSVVASDIPPFRFATAYKGVTLVDPQDAARFRSSILGALAGASRWQRDLSAFDIRETARRYEDLFTEVTASVAPGPTAS